MKYLLVLFVLFSGMNLVACAVHTREGSIVVDPDGHYGHDRDGRFCPPGQAKKGNC